MTDSLDQRDPLELLADEFASRCRRGDSPSVSEYTAKYPEYAAEIEELFPAVAMMEQFRRAESTQREAALKQTGLAPPPKRVGDFDVVQEIGRGGMGIVYEAEQRSLGRRVALKVLPRHVLLLDEHLKRFQREAQTAARLRHTNIVGVFGVGEQDGLHYYVMPLVRGVGLDEIIRQLRDAAERPAGSTPEPAPAAVPRDIGAIARALIARKFPAAPDAQPDATERSMVSAPTSRSSRSATRRLPAASGADGANGESCGHERGRSRPRYERRRLAPAHWRTVAQIGLQAAEALGYAHAHGTLHRDVKPGNLLLDAEGVLSVADFGLARAADPADWSRSGEVVGTLRYMAPEQLSGTADARSDVYALGLTLYELVTLRPAFDDADRRRLLHGGPGRREPVRPRKIDPAVSRDLETIILKCLAHEPSKRYPTAAALAADLRRFLEDRPIHARRASSIERAWRWCRRNPALAVTSALAALLLVAFTAAALTGYVQTRTAYTGAQAALARAEATSRLSLDVLEDIYLQLSPDRVWISSDADPGGDACACIGLRPGAGGAWSPERPLTQVPVSNQTAALLENLLAFYDRLAEQAGDDFEVMLESAIAGRRVGDIRQRLGQLDHAEEEYLKAVEKLTSLSNRPDAQPPIQTERATTPVARASCPWCSPDAQPRIRTEPMKPPVARASCPWCSPDAQPRIRTELARAYNELGSVRSAKLDPTGAYGSHRRALSVLESSQPADPLPAEYRYELARTYYFLANKHPGAPADRRGAVAVESAAPSGPYRYSSVECRRAAVRILEQLAREYPDAADYRFLLALCHRPSGTGPDPAGNPAGAAGRRRAIEILEDLKAEYPGIVDYRYELTVTYAWIHVGLFPWQGPSASPSEAEEALAKALDESGWLVDHNPTIPHYAASRAIILAKLGTIFWQTGRLAEAEEHLRRALDAQSAVIAEFPDLPSHNRVVLEFLRLRLAQVHYERTAPTDDRTTLGTSRDLLQTCIENLSQLLTRPELADDRLAHSSLPVAYDALSRVLDDVGEKQDAQEARKTGNALQSTSPEGRRYPWVQ